MSARTWAEGVGVGALALVALLLLDAYVRDSPTPQGDELICHLMARDPFDPHTFPFAYRFGVPLLVHVLPFSQEHSFSWLAWLFTAGCVFVMLAGALAIVDRRPVVLAAILLVA